MRIAPSFHARMRIAPSFAVGANQGPAIIGNYVNLKK
jgi:hypothetical protein